MAADGHYPSPVVAWTDLPFMLLGSVLVILLIYSFGTVALFHMDRRRRRISTRSCDEGGAVRVTAIQVLIVMAFGALGQGLLDTWPGWALAAFAVAGALAARWFPLPTNNPSRRAELVFLFLAVSVAFLIRIWRLNEIFPQGVEQDEYVWALDYLALLRGEGDPFGLGFFGIPVLHGSINALLFLQSGITPFAIRFPSVVYGSLTVIPLYFLAKAAFNSRAGFAAVAILVLWPYHVFYSRIVSGSRMVFGTTLSCALLLYGLREDRSRRSSAVVLSLAGMTAALASYDYFAVRALMVFLAVFWMVALVSSLQSWRLFAHRAGQCAYFSAGFLLVGLPFLIAWLADPAAALGRVEQESVIGSFLALDWGTISSQVGKTALMFNAYVPHGRTVWFSHPAVTYFDFVLAALFAVGVWATVFKLGSRWKIYGSLLLGLFCALAPTLLSSFPPCSHRAVLSIIPVTLILAMIIGRLVSALERCFRSHRNGVWAAVGAGCVIVALLCIQLAHRVELVDSLPIFHREDHIRSAHIRRLLDELGEFDREPGGRAPASLIVGPRIPFGLRTIHPEKSIFELTAQSLYPDHQRARNRVYAVNHLEPTMLDALDRLYPDPSSAPFLAAIWQSEDYFRVVREREMAVYRCSREENICLTKSGDFEAEVFLPLPAGEPPQRFIVRVTDTVTDQTIDPSRLQVDGQGGQELGSGRFHRIALAAEEEQLDLRRLVLDVHLPDAEDQRVLRVPLSELLIPARLPRWRMEAIFNDGFVSPAIDVPYLGIKDGLFLYGGLLTERMVREHGPAAAVMWERTLQIDAGGRYDLRFLLLRGELKVGVNGLAAMEGAGREGEQVDSVELSAGENRLRIEYRGNVGRATVYVSSLSRGETEVLWP